MFRTIEATASLLGRYRYVELACFHALGRRATSAVRPELVVALDAAARAHGWRATQIEGRLPVSLGLPGVVEATVAPVRDFDATLTALVATGDDVELLDALTGALYPAMVDAYRRHLGSVDPTADAPVARLLGRLLHDLEGVHRELLVISPPLDQPGARSLRLAAFFERVGGPFGGD